MPSALRLKPRSIWVAFVVSVSVGFFILNTLVPTLAFWAAIAFFIFGVPHGAVERLPGQRRVIMPTIAYTALYIVFGILVYSSWLISPVGTLTVFLALSAFHFGSSEPDIRSLGPWIILGPFLIYPDQTLSIFSFLTRADLGLVLTVETARYFAVLSLICVSAEMVWRLYRRGSIDIFRVVALLAIFIVLPPVIAVSLYFFCFHSLREMRRTIDNLESQPGRVDLSAILRLYAPASLPALFGAGVIIWAVLSGLTPLYLATGLAVAFIIPHMLPVEKLLEVDRNG